MKVLEITYTHAYTFQLNNDTSLCLPTTVVLGPGSIPYSESQLFRSYDWIGMDES